MGKSVPTAVDLRAVGYQAAPVVWPEDEPVDDFAEFSRFLQSDDGFAREAVADYIRSRCSTQPLLRKKTLALHDHPKHRACEHLMLTDPLRFSEVSRLEPGNPRTQVERAAREEAVRRYLDRRQLILKLVRELASGVIAEGVDRWISEVALTDRPPETVRKLLRLTQSPVLDRILEFADELAEEGATC